MYALMEGSINTVNAVRSGGGGINEVVDKGTQLSDMRRSRRFSLEIGGLSPTLLTRLDLATCTLVCTAKLT
jgi:hypothetical protein